MFSFISSRVVITPSYEEKSFRTLNYFVFVQQLKRFGKTYLCELCGWLTQNTADETKFMSGTVNCNRLKCGWYLININKRLLLRLYRLL